MKISVAICTYNGEKFIREQLQSIINQSRRPDEIIIYDDLSQDKTVSTIEKILYNCGIEYKIYVNTKNLGYEKNFYHAVKNTSGDIVFLSDQDDVWVNDKIEKVERVFVDNADISLVVHDVEVCDYKLNCISKSVWQEEGFNPYSKKMVYKSFFEGTHVQGCASAFKRNVIDLYGCPFPAGVSHDMWIGLVCEMYGKVYFLDEKLLKYRQHPNNTLGVSGHTWKKIVNGQSKIVKQLMKYRKTLEMSLKSKKYLIDNIRSEKSDKIFYYDCERNIEFLKKRLNIIDFGGFWAALKLVKMACEYLEFSYNIKRAVKSLIEDIMLTMNNRFDSCEK